MNKIWRENFKVRSNEVDFNNRLKLSSIFLYMQEAASNHASSLGFGYNDLSKNNETWVLSRVLLEIYDNVSFSQEIIVETWAKSIEKLFAIRDFLIFNNDRLIAKATTAWLLINSKTKRPLRINHFDHFYNGREPAFNEIPDKIKEPELKNFVTKRKANYTDIDLNNHVNNIKYIEFILDILGKDFFSNYKIVKVHLNFLNELKYDEEIIIQNFLFKNRYYFEGVIENKKIFQLNLDFIKIS